DGIRDKLVTGVQTCALPIFTDAMRVSIAAQACLPILELVLDWYAGWTGIVVYPGDFRVRRAELDEHGVMHEWDDELAGEAMPGEIGRASCRERGEVGGVAGS